MTIHFRDIMRVEPKKFKQDGSISDFSLCGEHDPDRNKIEFGDPWLVIKSESARRMACPKCLKIWTQEADRHGDYHKFRKMIHKVARAEQAVDAMKGKRK